MSEPTSIGEYQLANLQSGRVKFLFLDLRAPQEREAFEKDERWFQGSQSVSPVKVIETVRAQGYANDAPIVVICETGANSMAAAHELARNSFINVFVVEGGAKGLSEQFPD